MSVTFSKCNLILKTNGILKELGLGWWGDESRHSSNELPVITRKNELLETKGKPKTK